QQIQAQQFVAYVGDVAVENSVIANDDEVYSGAVEFNGTNGTFIGSAIKGFKSGIYLSGTNSVGLDDTSIWAVKGAAFMVNT
ncbi:hypothetical protein, partial [Staphylococcus aureus]